MATQLTHQGFVTQADQHLQNAQFLSQTQNPAARQVQRSQLPSGFTPGGSCEICHVLRTSNKFDQPDRSVSTLLANCHLEGDSGERRPALPH